MEKERKSTITQEGKYKVLSSKRIFDRPWLNVRLEEAELPDGRLVPEYYIIDYPTWVNIIAITEEGDMVMERQYRHGTGNTAFEIPCGVVEKEEDPLDAAKRELMEETGFGGGEWSFFMKGAPNPGSNSNYSYSFLAKGVRKIATQNLDDTEDIQVHILSQEYVKELLEAGEIIQVLHVAPLWKYFATK